VTWQAPKVGEVTTWQAGGLLSALAGLTCEAAAVAEGQQVDIRLPALKIEGMFRLQ